MYFALLWGLGQVQIGGGFRVQCAVVERGQILNAHDFRICIVLPVNNYLLPNLHYIAIQRRRVCYCTHKLWQVTC